MGRGNLFVGRSGEIAASNFLKRCGYRILKTNFRTPFGEIDIIARHNGVIVFVEVKTRLTDSLGPPYLSVTKLKQLRIVRNALFYLKRRGLAQTDWRIDIVSVKISPLNGAVEKIEIIENAVDDINV